MFTSLLSLRAVDGNENNAFTANSCTHTAEELEKWWMVDLGAEYFVER